MENIRQQIIKVNYINKTSNIYSIFVFCGNLDVKMYENLFKTEPNNEVFKSIFREEELDNIQKLNIQVYFINEYIHLDDTIDEIKKKIVISFSQFQNEICLEEIYLFCLREQLLNSDNIYETLSQNNKLPITRIRMNEFLLNILRDENGNVVNLSIPDQEEYNYESILSLNLNNKKFWVSNVLGQKFFIDYVFVINPYQLIYDSFLDKASNKIVSTSNSNLLLNNGPIIENNIYLCLAQDVLESQDKSYEEFILKIYFPLLFYNDNLDLKVTSLNTLNEKREKLVNHTKSIISSSTMEYFKVCNLFYNIYYDKKEDLDYLKKGIKNIQFTLFPQHKINFPLDVIFKLIHASPTRPLIKFNNDRDTKMKQDKIYRLYTDKISKDGRKIPYLPKSKIFSLMKEIGKFKSVCVYILHKDNLTNPNDNSNDNGNGNKYNTLARKDKYSESNISLLCMFLENGNIVISCDLQDVVVDIQKLNNIIKTAVNPVINEIKQYFDNNGYNITLFQSLFDENIEINRMDYQAVINIKKSFNIQKWKKCVGSIFVIENENQFRFKRVSNFNKTNSQQAFIFDKIKQNDSHQEIIEGLINSYTLTESEANEIYANYVNELYRNTERGFKRNIEIKINPGFKTTFSISNRTNLNVIVQNINNINYLNTLPIYLDSVVRITQEKESITKVFKETCTGNEEVNEGETIQDIHFDSKVQAEVGVITNLNEEPSFATIEENLSILENSENYEDEKKIDDFFDLIGVTNEEEEEEEDMEGGNGGNDDTFQNIDGTPITYNSNPFFNKMKKYDSVLFLNKKEGKFNAYSRTCPSSARRQPVLLTEEEKQRIDLEQPGFLKPQDVIKYGSDPQKQFYYVCPRYWCLKTDSPISPEDVASGKCGKVIPRDAKTVPKGHYVYEFFGKDHGTQENYIQHYPGFIPGKHPKGLCIPCCFKNWDTKGQIKRRDKCLNRTNKSLKDNDDESEEDDEDEEGEEGEEREKEIEEKEKEREEREKEIQQEQKQEQQQEIQQEQEQQQEQEIQQAQEQQQEQEIQQQQEQQQEQEIQQAQEQQQEQEIQQEPQQEREKENLPREKENKLGQKTEKNKPIKVLAKEDYIKGPEKFPLDSKRWGYLPPSIEMFLQQENTKCQISKTNPNIKPNHTCLLRHGVENNDKQSFIACISDALYFGVVNPVKSISMMKKIIIESLNIDNYIIYQNGNLVPTFLNKERKEEINISKYESSQTYTNYKNNKIQEEIFKNIVNSFENFIEYLKDDTISINYEYLWDIICTPNDKLFVKGINLIILEIMNNDNSNNVEFICPSNFYSNEKYDPRKCSLFLIKNEDFYEPIYSYRIEKNKLNVSKFFCEYDRTLMPTLSSLFKNVIKPIYINNCIPYSSMSKKVYEYKRPLLLNNLIELLKNKYKIKNQVINYQSKIIGLIITFPIPNSSFAVSQKKNGKVDNAEKEINAFIPCFPSSINKDLEKNAPLLFMQDVEFNDYANTIYYLKKIKKKINEINCYPAFKIIEEEHVVAILTETNQLIPLSEPISLINIVNEDEIPNLNNSNYLVSTPEATSDLEIFKESLSNDVDFERVDYIRKIKQETEYYSLFRNTLRILLNDYKNFDTREKIANLMTNTYMLYNIKLLSIISLLKELSKNKIKFINGNIENDFTEYTIYIPKNNLITNKNDNEKYYYGKIADELIRYKRINSFIFKPQVYLSFGNIGYNLRENEIILISSQLSQNYFNNLIPIVVNKYIKNNTYDTAEPIQKITNDNNIVKINKFGIINEKQKEIVKEKETVKENETKEISSLIWKKCFPSKKYNEVVYPDTFSLLKNIVRQLPEENTETIIKNELYTQYSKYLEIYENEILDILIEEGKKTLGNLVKDKKLSFREMILSNKYFITNFDLWILLAHYKIPSFFISTYNISLNNIFPTENNNDKKIAFVAFGNEPANFLFIFCPALRTDTIPKYKIVQSKDNEIYFPLSTFSGECFNYVNKAYERRISISNYLRIKKPVMEGEVLNFPITDVKKTKKIKVIVRKTIKAKKPV